MTDQPWLKWQAYLGYYTHERQHKEVAMVEFYARSGNAADSYARRHAEALFDTSWGAYWRIVSGPNIPEGAS
jgi:hypothetical protein